MLNIKKPNLSDRLTTPIFVICCLILIAFIGSNFVVLRSAGAIADSVHVEDQRQLISNEFQRQMEIVARDQSQISHWDATLAALGDEIDREFVRNEIAEWLWGDFDIENTVVVGPDGEARLRIRKSAILSPKTADSLISQNADLMQEAVNRYMDQRIKSGSGYTIADDPVASTNPIYTADIRSIDGITNVVIAQAIVPHGAFRLPDGLPHVMLTTKPFTDTDFAYIEHKLDLPALTLLSPDEFSDEQGNRVKVGKSGFGASWESNLPSTTVWNESLPILGILISAVSLGLLYISIRYSRILAALRASEKRNKFLALHDALTGLPNRLQLDQALEDVISKGQVDRCAILCIDLDRFKSVNDIYGHQAGDAVIQTVASRMLEAVGTAGMPARIGGDEFVVLLRDNLEKPEVLKLCDQLIASISKKVSFEGGSANVGASIGVAWWPDDAVTSKMVIKSADEALYRAKENGRGRAFLAGEEPEKGSDSLAA